MANESLLTVIIGAGASYDCVDPNDTGCFDSDYRPPLVHELFASRRPFNAILNKYPRARTRSGEIRAALTREGGSVTLERILLEIREGGAYDKADFIQIPLYLQELLGTVGEHYVTKGGSSRFDLLVRLIERSHYDAVLFLTLNYDLFLEKALEVYYSYQFEQIMSYLPENLKWKLVKLHGSVNWGHRITNFPPEVQHQDILIPLDTLRGELQLDPRFQILPNHQVRRHANGIFYPAIAVPVEGKTEFVCPEPHVDFMRDFLSRCRDFLICGFSALDLHVLNELKAVPAVDKLMVVCANPQESSNTMDRIFGRCEQFRNAQSKTYIESPYPRGFSDLVVSDELRVFLGVT